jgi:DNA-binding transcriptional ArsR family regulator
MTDISHALVALADPTRRAIFERIAEGECSVADLARALPVSQPAVSQHLKVLKAAGLASHRAEGARHLYRVDPMGLGPLRAWLDRFWEDQLDAFKAAAEASAPKKRKPRHG